MRGWEVEGWISEELGVRMEVNIIKIHKVLEELIKYCWIKAGGWLGRSSWC